MLELIYYIKQFAIIRFLWNLLKCLWPLFILMIFWDDIDGFMCRYPLWNEAMGRIHDFWLVFSTSDIFIKCSSFLRSVGTEIAALARPVIRTVSDLIQGVFS